MTADDDADLNLSLMPKLEWVQVRLFALVYKNTYLIDRDNFDLVFQRDKCFVYSAVKSGSCPPRCPRTTPFPCQCWPRSPRRLLEGGRRRAMNKGYHPAVPPARRQALVDARCTLGTEQAGTGDGVTPTDGDRM